MKIFTFCLSIIISFVMLEGLTRLIIDDGLNYDIEMMKYAVYFKSVSNNPKVGLEHKKNVEKKLMNVEISLNSDGFRKYPNLSMDSSLMASKYSLPLEEFSSMFSYNMPSSFKILLAYKCIFSDRYL